MHYIFRLIQVANIFHGKTTQRLKQVLKNDFKSFFAIVGQDRQFQLTISGYYHKLLPIIKSDSKLIPNE